MSDTEPEYLDLTQLAELVGVPLTTLTKLLPPEVREMMDKVGRPGRWRYNARYVPILLAMVSAVDGNGNRIVKPGSATLYLKDRVQKLNEAATSSDLQIPETGFPKPETGISPVLPPADTLQRALIALERIASGEANRPDKLLTKKEAREEFGIGAGTLSRLPSVIEGRGRKWKRSTLARYIASL